MAISMGAALLGSAVIGGGASAIGASANSSAINNATAAQSQATRDSLALQRDIYGKNNALLSPFVERGNAAGNQINALLGLGTPNDYEAYVQANPDLLADYNNVAGQYGSVGAYGQHHYDTYGRGEGRDLPNGGNSAQNAFDVFRNSTGYQFRVDEGNKAANALLFANGAMESGAAVKSALARAQNLASGEFGNYMGYLSNQQGVGLGGASAVAGVGQNYASNVTATNQNNANALSSLALAKGQNTNDMLGGLASSFGLGAGALTKWGK